MANRRKQNVNSCQILSDFMEWIWDAGIRNYSGCGPRNCLIEEALNIWNFRKWAIIFMWKNFLKWIFKNLFFLFFSYFFYTTFFFQEGSQGIAGASLKYFLFLHSFFLSFSDSKMTWNNMHICTLIFFFLEMSFLLFTPFFYAQVYSVGSLWWI